MTFTKALFVAREFVCSAHLLRMIAIIDIFDLISISRDVADVDDGTKSRLSQDKPITSLTSRMRHWRGSRSCDLGARRTLELFWCISPFGCEPHVWPIESRVWNNHGFQAIRTGVYSTIPQPFRALELNASTVCIIAVKQVTHQCLLSYWQRELVAFPRPIGQPN